jgi:hypothetical protein
MRTYVVMVLGVAIMRGIVGQMRCGVITAIEGMRRAGGISPRLAAAITLRMTTGITTGITTGGTVTGMTTVFRVVTALTAGIITSACLATAIRH